MSDAIVVVPYSTSWAHQFDQLRQRLQQTLDAAGVDPPPTIEHVGSTSVVGIWAKPILDVDIITNREHVDQIQSALADSGYDDRGDLGIPYRYAFQMADHEIGHNLYVVIDSSLALRNHLAVRGALRSSEDLRSRYSSLKRELADSVVDIDTYVSGKSEMIQGILRDAGLSEASLAAIEASN